jgi:hypothetical protein
MKKHGFILAKHKTLHLSQQMQKHSEWHHGIRSSSHHGHNGGGESSWDITTKHKCNVSYRKPEDGGGLI